MVKTPPSERDYRIGKGKPPVATRFKAGQSGNPKGRPPKRKTATPASPMPRSLRDTVLKVGRRVIKVRDNGDEAEMSAVEAILQRESVSAMTGSTRAAQAFIRKYQTAEDEEQAEWDELVALVTESQRAWRAHRKACEERGQSYAHLVPNPDDVILNHDTHQVMFIGPVTEEESEVWWERERQRRDGAWHLIVATNLMRIAYAEGRHFDAYDLRDRLIELEVVLADLNCRYPSLETRQAADFKWDEWHIAQRRRVYDLIEERDQGVSWRRYNEIMNEPPLWRGKLPPLPDEQLDPPDDQEE